MKEILAALDYVITFMKKTGALGNSTISNYCIDWNIDKNTVSDLKVPAIAETQLRHIVGLYHY